VRGTHALDFIRFVIKVTLSVACFEIYYNKFGAENLIGKGGYAEVYKGCLPNHRLVAFKRLTRGTPDEIIGDFLSELGVMAHVNHPNTAKLVGYGVDGGMYLVLELSEKGSLASVLYGIESID